MSSYGGMGGYGSMYGGGMYGGMGGMYGSGMLGSVDGQEKGFIMNTLAALHSFGFLVHSLGEIGKTLEMNIDGIHKFYDSFKSNPYFQLRLTLPSEELRSDQPGQLPKPHKNVLRKDAQLHKREAVLNELKGQVQDEPLAEHLHQSAVFGLRN